MVAGHARNTSVTMLTDGELLRLTKQQFIDVVRDALVETVPYAIAQRMHTEGAVWIDVRESEEHTNGALPTAINLPLSELRENARDLIKDQPYLVCGENGGAASVATLLLAQRGFDAVCVTEPVSASLRSSSAPAKCERLSNQGSEPNEKVVAFLRDTEKTIAQLNKHAFRRKNSV
jgi:rhodanese-related sulfurtransferase